MTMSLYRKNSPKVALRGTKRSAENDRLRYRIQPYWGTKRVSDLFTETFCGQSSHIDLANRSNDFSAFSFNKEDTCIVAVPSYGGKVPATAVVWLARMKGNGARAVLIVVYENRAYNDTFAELQDSSVWRR